jgi:proline racemase
VAGYAADLRYEAESKNFLRQRMGQKLTFGGESYNIVAITQNGVTLEDSRTKKRTIIQWSVAR